MMYLAISLDVILILSCLLASLNNYNLAVVGNHKQSNFLLGHKRMHNTQCQ